MCSLTASMGGTPLTSKKFNCQTKKYLVHQRYLNEELHWTEIDSVWTWKDVLLPDDADHFQWVCSWSKPLAKTNPDGSS